MKTIKKTFLFGTISLSLLGLWIPSTIGLVVAGGCGSKGPTAVVVKAIAGADQDVLLNVVATFDGKSSTGVTSSHWTLTSIPTGSAATLSGASSLTPSFTPDVAGDYVAELSINDGASTDSVTFTAKGSLVAISVPDGSAITTRERFGETEYVVNLGQVGATLTGAGSRLAGLTALTVKDAEAVTYKWEQVSGPGATAVGGGTLGETLEFVAPTLINFQNLSPSDRYKWQPLRISRNDTKMIFKLTVTSADGTTSDSATFTVFIQDDDKEIHTTTGLQSVGIGTTVYLSGPSLNAAGASAADATLHDGSSITDWNWTLTAPTGSTAVFKDTGGNTSAIEFPSFIPDIPGIYTINFSSATGNAGGSALKTVKVPGTMLINAADYVGVGSIGGATPKGAQCGACHDGNDTSAPEFFGDKVAEWNGTKHARVFEDAMDIYKGLTPEPYLWEFHTVGYNKDARNKGFDDIASAELFNFPLTGLTFSEFTTDYPDIAKLSNVQCESCHGPGSEHQGDPLRITFSFSQYGVCGQCHIQEEQWMNSAHNSTGVEHGSGSYQNSWPGTTSSSCTRCHTAAGFTNFVEQGEDGLKILADADDHGVFPGITCAACHDPHDATNPKQLRQAGNVTMAIDGSTVEAGKAAVCYTCHDGNYALGEKQCDSDSNGVADATCTTADQTAVQYWRGGYHYAVQSPILEGKQALRDLDKGGPQEGAFVMTFTENSFHSGSSFSPAEVTRDWSLSSENNKCVTCHMAQGPSVEQEGYQHLGGHSFKLRTGHGLGHLQVSEDDPGTAETGGDLELVSACQTCHAGLTDFNRTSDSTYKVLDYDGDGTIGGIQDEIKGLLHNVSNKIKEADAGPQAVPYTAGNINTTATSFNSVIGATLDAGGAIQVDALAWRGDCSSFSGTTGAACGLGIAGTGSCTNVAPAKTKDEYQPCNFAEANPILRRAVWNYNSVVRDGSLGIHNAAYVIQVLQKTYQAIGVLLEGKTPEGAAYTKDFPSAKLR